MFRGTRFPGTSSRSRSATGSCRGPTTACRCWRRSASFRRTLTPPPRGPTWSRPPRRRAQRRTNHLRSGTRGHACARPANRPDGTITGAAVGGTLDVIVWLLIAALLVVALAAAATWFRRFLLERGGRTLECGRRLPAASWPPGIVSYHRDELHWCRALGVLLRPGRVL